jgi:ketosteroid isomerase-like protein
MWIRTAAASLLGFVLLGHQRIDPRVLEFRAIEEARSLALKTADVPAVDRLYADDFVGISASGEVIRKKELLENVRARGPQELTFVAEDLEVRLEGEIALVMGRIRGRDPGGRLVRDGRFLHVYARRDGEWQIVAAQATPIVP